MAVFSDFSSLSLTLFQWYLANIFDVLLESVRYSHGKNGFATATKLGTTNSFFLAATKTFAAATKRFVDRAKHFVVATKYFRYPYFDKLFSRYNKTFYTVQID